MPLGGFRLNTLGKKLGAGAETYFILSRSANIDAQTFRITTDSNKNIYINPSDGGTGLYYKVDETGSLLWQKKQTNEINYSSYGGNSVLDSSNNPVFAIYESTATQQQFLCSLSGSDGSLLYSTKRTSTGSVYIGGSHNIVKDSSGNYYTSMVVNTGTGNRPGIWKWNSDGSLNTARGIFRSGDGDATANGQFIAIDSSNNIYMFSNIGNSKRIWKLDSSLTTQWVYSITGSTFFCRNIVCDSSGNIIIYRTRHITKIDSNGNIVWERLISLDGNDVANAMAIDSNDNVYIYFRNDKEQLIKVNSSGTLQFSRTLNVNRGANDEGSTVRPRIHVSGNNMYLYGTGRNTSGTIVSYILKLPTDGTLTGTIASGTLGFTYATGSVTLSNDSGTYSMTSLTGSTYTVTQSAATETLGFTTQTHSAYTKVNV